MSFQYKAVMVDSELRKCDFYLNDKQSHVLCSVQNVIPVWDCLGQRKESGSRWCWGGSGGSWWKRSRVKWLSCPAPRLHWTPSLLHAPHLHTHTKAAITLLQVFASTGHSSTSGARNGSQQILKIVYKNKYACWEKNKQTCVWESIQRVCNKHFIFFICSFFFWRNQLLSCTLIFHFPPVKIQALQCTW